jgi:hypothetical protein
VHSIRRIKIKGGRMSDTLRINVYDRDGRRLGQATFSWDEEGKTRMFIDNSPVQGPLSRMGDGLLAVRGNYMDSAGTIHNPVYVKESEWSDAQQPDDK